MATTCAQPPTVTGAVQPGPVAAIVLPSAAVNFSETAGAALFSTFVRVVLTAKVLALWCSSSTYAIPDGKLVETSLPRQNSSSISIEIAETRDNVHTFRLK
jgi:hypothetical protein